MPPFLKPELNTDVAANLLLLSPLEPFVNKLVNAQAARDAELSAPWEPFPKQALATALAAESDELLFGGAAGPGKTEWLMRYGIDQMERYPGNRGVIFRRVFPSLQRSIIPRLQLLLSDKAAWNENKKTFTFTNRSILEVSSLQYKHTVTDFQGAEYGWIGFEELTEFLQFQWEFLIGRLRVPATVPPLCDHATRAVPRCEDCTIRPHACATTNPGGLGHKWVKRRFVKPEADDLEVGQLRPKPTEVWRPRFDPIIHSEKALPLRRVYIPAVHTDNPALLANDPGYLAKILANSNRGLRQALEHGDWDALDSVEGALWSLEEIDNGRIAPQFYRNTVDVLRRVVAVDPSDGDEGGDAYGLAVCARGADGIGYVEETHEWRNLAPAKLAKTTLALAKRVQADAIVIEKNHGGKWLLAVFESLDPYANISLVWASDNKRTRAEPVSALFEWDEQGQPQCRAKIVGFQPDCEDELTQTSFTSGEDSPNILDALVWGLSDLMLGKGKAARKQSTVDDQRLTGRR